MSDDPTRGAARGASRREFLWTGAALGGGAAVGLLGGGHLARLAYWLRGESPHADLDYAATLARLAESLTTGQRRALILPADHPSRQLTNTVAIFRGPHMGTLLDASQIALVARLYEHMTSHSGRGDLAATLALEGKFEGSTLAFYGDPDSGRAHSMISGGHIMLRGGGLSANGTAFGGPIAYGQQIGNGRFKIEGNAFAYQSDRANDLYAALAPEHRRRARVAEPPYEMVVQAQAQGGRFEGIRVGDADEAAQEAARRLLDAVLSTWSDPDRLDAWSCIDHNGGIEALHVAFYESKGFYADGSVWSELSADERESREAAYWQVWRIEGPGTAIHFKGSPHVHAYVNIVRDPARQNVGDVIGETSELLQGADLQPLLEASLLRETGVELAFHPADQVTGRFCPGEITTGLAWTLDPFGNRVALAEIRGDALAQPLRDSLEQRGLVIESDRIYRIAMPDYFAHREDWVGRPERVERGSRTLREAVIDQLRIGGLPRASA